MLNVSNDGSVTVDPILDILAALDVSMERPSGSLVSRVRADIRGSAAVGVAAELVTTLNWNGDSGRFYREFIVDTSQVFDEAALEEIQSITAQFSANNRDLRGGDLETEMKEAKSGIMLTIMDVVLQPAGSGRWTGQYDYGYESLYIEVYAVDGAVESASAVLDTQGVVVTQSWEFVD